MSSRRSGRCRATRKSVSTASAMIWRQTSNTSGGASIDLPKGAADPHITVPVHTAASPSARWRRVVLGGLGPLSAAELSAECVWITGGQLAGEVATHVRRTVVSIGPQRRIESFAPRHDRVGTVVLADDRQQILPITGDDDLVDTVRREIEGAQQLSEGCWMAVGEFAE